MSGQRFFEEVAEGQVLPELTKRPTTTMLFRFSAMTWNAHRIHYDEPYARSEGHPGVLVQATMHGAFLMEMVTGFAGPGGRIGTFSYSNRGIAVAGDTLTLGGTVREVRPASGSVVCDIWERRQDGSICAAGEATVILPRRSGPAVT